MAWGMPPEWFADARALLGAAELPDWATARLAFEVGHARWHLVVERGSVTAFGEGGLGNADVTVQWQRADARAILGGALGGNDALLATTVVDGDYSGTPAPLNLTRRGELSALPRIPGVTLVVQYRHTHGPFGDVSYVLEFEDGRVVGERLGAAESPNVSVDVPYRAMALVRAGEMTILEALEDGQVAGELGPLAALAGILECDEFHAAELATGRHAIALAALGRLYPCPQYGRSMRALATMFTER